MNAVMGDPSLIQMSLFDFIDVIERTPKDVESQHIETVLLLGSGIQRGKTRIHDYSMTNPTVSDFANMLKNEYGIGGRSPVNHEIRDEMHDGGGIKFKWRNDGEWVETKIAWIKGAQIILKLIKEGRYKF